MKTLTREQRTTFRTQASRAYRNAMEELSKQDLDGMSKSMGGNAITRDYEWLLDEIDRSSGYRTR